MQPQQPAINPLPAAVIVLFLPVVGMELYFAGANMGLWGRGNARLDMVRQLAVLPEAVHMNWNLGRWNIDLSRLVLYPFVHASTLSATFGAVFILALGKFVGDAMGNRTVIITFFSAAIFGALAYVFLTPDTYPLFGAYPAAYGLIGAFTYVRFAQAEGLGAQQMMAFQLLAILMAINLIFALVTGGPDLWVAELAGALAGFLTAAALRPGGIPHLIAKMRRR
ncbi:MAG: rhomboid family intramembrane serine protease [Planktomarina sp.]